MRWMRGPRSPLWWIIEAVALTGCTDLLGIDRDYTEAPQDAGASHEAAPSPEASCSSANLHTDSQNCGRCSHDCQGGGCVGGVCQPVVLASLDSPWGIAVDANNVYFTTDVPDGSVYECPLSGCSGKPVVLASGLASPARIVVQSDTVYWANYLGGSIDSCPVNGCTDGKPSVLAMGQEDPTGIAVYGDFVYWTNSAFSGVGSVRKCPTKGGATTTLAPHEIAPETVAVDGSGVYWVGAGGDGGSGELKFCALDGGEPTPLVKDQSGAFFVTLFQGSVYWSDQTPSGFVRSCSEPTCATITSVASPDKPAEVAVDASGIYWVSYVSDGTIQKCPPLPAGCGSAPPTYLARNQGTPFAIALDETSVYWTNTKGADGGTGGNVMKVAKP
jgi:hypothetical protein